MIKSKLSESDFLIVAHQSEDAVFEKRKRLAIKYALISVIFFIVVRLAFGWNMLLMNQIYSFFFIFLWILPILFIKLRNYLHSFLSVKTKRYGNIMFCIGLIFMFVTIASFTSLILMIYGIKPIHLYNLIKWVSVIVFIPYFLAIIAIK